MIVPLDISLAVADPGLATLSFRYASALDQRDLPALLGVFHPDATLRAQPPGRGPMVLTGHQRLAKLIQAVAHWPRTFHLVGQGLFRVDDDQAVGEVYCVAHHFNSDVPGRLDDDIMYIRYQDVYVKDPDRGWVIMERVVITDGVGYDTPPAG